MNSIRNRRHRIRLSIRKKIKGTEERPRISIFKSNKNIYAQIIDDVKSCTLVASCSADVGEKDKITVEIAKKVGQKLAEKAKEKKITQVVFDRSGYPYHGKVRALAEGAREKGLVF